MALYACLLIPKSDRPGFGDYAAYFGEWDPGFQLQCLVAAF